MPNIWYETDPPHLIITGPQALSCLLHEMSKFLGKAARMIVLTEHTAYHVEDRLADRYPEELFFVVIAGDHFPEPLLDLCQRVIEEGHNAKVHLLAAYLRAENVPERLRTITQIIEC